MNDYQDWKNKIEKVYPQVFITSQGKCYHRFSHYRQKDGNLHLWQAIYQGYRACSICKPHNAIKVTEWPSIYIFHFDKFFGIPLVLCLLEIINKMKNSNKENSPNSAIERKLGAPLR